MKEVLKTEITTVTQVAQMALEALVMGETVDESDHALLTERRRTFLLQQRGRGGVFDLSKVLVYRKLEPFPRVVIDVATDKGPEYFRLGFDLDGNSDFQVVCLEDVAGDPC